MSTEMTTLGAAGWIEYSGPDNDAAKQFYSKVMGWNIADIPMEDGSGYTGIMVGEAPIGGFAPQPAKTGSWTIYVTVADVDASFKTALDLGATANFEPMDVKGVGRLAQITDPQGASISLITYESMK